MTTMKRFLDVLLPLSFNNKVISSSAHIAHVLLCRACFMQVSTIQQILCLFSFNYSFLLAVAVMIFHAKILFFSALNANDFLLQVFCMRIKTV